MFPLAFVFIFGSFSNVKNLTVIGVDANVGMDNPTYQALDAIASSENTPIELKRASLADLKEDLEDGKVDGIIQAGDVPVRFTLLTSNTNPEGSAAASSFIAGAVDKVNLKVLGAPPTITFTSQEVSGKSLRLIDFILPGQIGFSLISIVTFGVAFPFLTLRKTLVLKRLFATSMKPISFIFAQALARSVQGVLQALVIILFGVWAFDFSLAHGWLTVVQMLVVAFLATMGFLGFGLFFSNVAKDEQTMPIVLNLFNLPQFLLSGVFFATDGLPEWLAKIGNNLPLSYTNTAMRKIAVEGLSLVEVWPYILGIIAWSIFAYFIAAKTFKSE
jgi:ABC-2 type transport system permease protein